MSVQDLEKLKKRNDDQIERGCGNRLSDLSANEVAALLARLEQAERERDLMKGQMNAAFEAEKSDCSKALLAMCAAQKCTPAETYGSNSSWAISDLCRALKEDAAALRTLRQAAGDIECTECFHPLSLHADKDGCQFDRGDRQLGEGEISVAVGPCSCKGGCESETALAAALAAEGGK